MYTEAAKNSRDDGFGWPRHIYAAGSEASDIEINLTVQDLILNLKAAGFAEGQMGDYLTVWAKGETGEQLRLLSEKRRGSYHHHTGRQYQEPPFRAHLRTIRGEYDSGRS